ncbi:DUF4834 family protein [Aestuariibaculum suncheonense]|uniref:DUF4834 family protein n=1 Tax=Aestuariibaculum suncheonense TaxID=1028745 RepID=A0A8J6UAG6_9FLAO|nr:DUF4834 family protein [Aestuariibaculum suncheonense]MBD0835288.1 DUF4834 family protein [Aestuariibaculum suncheonense]
MIQQASVNGLIRMILIIILVYYGIKIVSRLLTPFLIKYVSKKAEERFGGQFGQFQQQRRQESPKKEGEVTIDKMPNTKTSNKEVGEYVDYEEID